MKSINHIIFSASVAIIAAIAPGCSSNPVDEGAVTAILNEIVIEYDGNGVWKGAMDATATINYGDMTFTHRAYPDWNSWNGFVASRSSDVKDYSDANWLDHQFTAITGGGMSGTATPYLVAYWNSSELLDDAATSAPSCSVTLGSEGTLFRPLSAFVTNTTYVYYAMLNGTAWSKKFEPNDYLQLLAYGIAADGTITGPASIDLARYKSEYDTPLKQWVYFDMSSLGVVKKVFFRMESSDTGEWGMNTPAYFAIDRMSIMPEKQ